MSKRKPQTPEQKETARLRCRAYYYKQKAAGVYDTEEYKEKQRQRQKRRYKTKAVRDAELYNNFLSIKW